MLQGQLTRSLPAGPAKQGGVHARLFSIYIFAVVRKRVGSKLRKAPESWARMAPPPLPCTAPRTTGRAFVYCSQKRIFSKGWTGQYLRCCLCCDVQHCTTKEGNSPSRVLLLSALLSWPGCAGWTRSPLTELPWKTNHGCSRRRENHNLPKAQLLHRKPIIRKWILLCHCLLCISQEITSDCTKRFASRELIQKSWLVSRFPSLESHSWGNSVFRAKLNRCHSSEGPVASQNRKQN